MNWLGLWRLPGVDGFSAKGPFVAVGATDARAMLLAKLDEEQVRLVPGMQVAVLGPVTRAAIAGVASHEVIMDEQPTLEVWTYRAEWVDARAAQVEWVDAGAT